MARPVVKRETVLRAALELFVEKGISATTTREIAERAQAAEGTMYRYYPGKDDLAWDLYFSNLEVFMMDLRGCLKDAQTTCDKLRSMIAEFFRLYDDDPVLYNYLVLAEHSLISRLPSDFQTPPALLVQVLSEGQANGEVDDVDLNEAAALIMGTVVRLTVFRYHGRIDGALTDRVDSIHRLCWRALAKAQISPSRPIPAIR